MKRTGIFKLSLLIISIFLLISFIGFGSFYVYWNKASPEKTCASCHEIVKSVNSFALSAHRNLKCQECHGTALSNGIHSMKEKGMMVISHMKKENNESIRLNEDQIIELMNNCKRCHSSEYAKWTSGGHSIDYQHLFLNVKHNSTEQINFDCLRCHGMFYKGTMEDIVKPINRKGPWELKDQRIATIPAIPCFTCHQVHQEGFSFSKPDYSDPKAIFYKKKSSNSNLSFYDRHEKSHFSVSDLPRLNLWQGKRVVKVSDDIIMRNCVQCHAPDAGHQAGTSDDKTPRGVHEGLSCTACHEPHSNNAKNSCIGCHPAISNCKIDVTKMNTTYFDAKSPNNIHFVACKDCHTDQKINSSFRKKDLSISSLLN